MATYNYKVVDSSGSETKGTIDAKSQELATDKLKKDGLTVISIKEQSALQKDVSISIGAPVKVNELAMFCTQFVSILEAGVTVVTALDMLSEQTDNKIFGKTLKEVQIMVEKGETLSGAMKRFPKIFPSMLVNMVAAGEASGSLETAFKRMAVHFEKDYKLKATIKKAMIYPIMVLSVAIIVVIVMLVGVIPTFQTMFEDMDMKLPAATQAMVNMSTFMRTKWYLVIIVVVAIVVGIKLFKSTPAGTMFFAKLGLKAPLFGNLTVKSSAARFSRTLSTLLASGIPLIDAIESVAKIMTNKIVQDGVLEAKNQVARGVPLSKPLKDMDVFPPLLIHMTRIGEETGALESMLERVAGFYDQEVEDATEKLTSALEPLIIIIMALMVGGVIMAIMSPMIKMYDGLDTEGE